MVIKPQPVNRSVLFCLFCHVYMLKCCCILFQIYFQLSCRWLLFFFFLWKGYTQQCLKYVCQCWSNVLACVILSSFCQTQQLWGERQLLDGTSTSQTSLAEDQVFFQIKLHVSICFFELWGFRLRSMFRRYN